MSAVLGFLRAGSGSDSGSDAVFDPWGSSLAGAVRARLGALLRVVSYVYTHFHLKLTASIYHGVLDKWTILTLQGV